MSMGIEENYQELMNHIEALENFGLKAGKIQSLKHAAKELYALSKESMKFNIGDQVKIIKNINFDNSPGWKPFQKQLSLGCVGTVKRYCYNTYHLYPYVDFEIMIPKWDGGEEKVIFMMPVKYLGRIEE